MNTMEQAIAFMEARHADTAYGALGIRVLSYDPEAVGLQIDIDTRHLQHAGVLHGGISVLLAESAASMAAALTTDLSQHSVGGMEINANHLRRVHQGTVTAVATPIHRGQTTHVYGVELRDQTDALVCVCRCTIAIRPLRGGLLGQG